MTIRRWPSRSSNAPVIRERDSLGGMTPYREMVHAGRKSGCSQQRRLDSGSHGSFSSNAVSGPWHHHSGEMPTNHQLDGERCAVDRERFSGKALARNTIARAASSG